MEREIIEGIYILEGKTLIYHLLKFLNFTKLFKGHTNASDFVIKGILMQDGHPIGFESKKFYGTQL